MVAVLTVFANHLWGWPHGGFIGVDVFFVISGFLITSNLLRTAEAQGNVSFREFYWNRVRRIMPAATVVLLFTVAAAYAVFLPFRAREVGVDAGWAFVFLSNWWFAYRGTDYFRVATESVSPLQHYWSLSIEEQFYFVWPALIFLIGIVVARKALSHDRRMRLAGMVMAGIVAVSLCWALFQTAADPIAAYFNTFSRVWELGVGALLATAVGGLARIPTAVKPILSWAGLGLIAAALFLISEESAGFPAPWALLPVIGAGMVIAAGVGEEPNYQAFLRNPVSGYLGDISYSLYLVHWPVIVFLGALMDGGLHYSLTVVGLAFGFAIASYHGIENPFRKGDWDKFRETTRAIRKRRFYPEQSSAYAMLAALTCIVVGVTAFALRPVQPPTAPPPLVTASGTDESDPAQPQMGPEAAALHTEIVAALKATTWPQLNPSIESIIADPLSAIAGIPGCSGATYLDESLCTWGSSGAPMRIVVIGNSVALNYTAPLRDIALNSGDRIQVRTLAMPGCSFVNDLVVTEDQALLDACPARKSHAVEVINETKPDVVIIAHSYARKRVSGADRDMTPGEWAQSLKQYVDTFRQSTSKVGFLAPAPGDVQISECYGNRSHTPADCIGSIGPEWRSMAEVEQNLAKDIGGVWIDSRPWFCSDGKFCPSFVGTTLTKVDAAHMVPAYGQKITPVIIETFQRAGIL